MRNDFSSNYLMHHGILGQKWGVRRYQNPDGTLTPAGRERYGVSEAKDVSSTKGMERRLNDLDKAIARNKRYINENLAKGNKYHKKAQKAKTDEKHDELERKADAEFAKNKVFMDNVKKGEEEINDILKRAEENGYLVTSRETNRSVANGKDVISSALKTAVATTVLLPFGAAGVVVDRKTVKGTKYDVQDKKARIIKEMTDMRTNGASKEELAKKYEEYNKAANGTESKSKPSKNDSKTATSLNDGFGKYKVDKQYAHLYDAIELKNKSETQQKLGNDKVNFVINNYNYNRETRSYEQAEPQEKAVQRAQNFLKNFNVNEAKEEIAKQYYDSWKEEYKDQGVSRSEFKAAIKPYSVDIDNHEAYVAFDDGGLVGYHSLDIGVDPETMKIRYHSMNG